MDLPSAILSPRPRNCKPFGNRILGFLGMGGQGDTSYSSASYPVEEALLCIEPSNAVPVYILTKDSATDPFDTAWQFDPYFLKADRGLAPRAFDWDAGWAFRERQEFQVVEDAWMFNRGDAWWETNSIGFAGHIQTLEMIDVKVHQHWGPDPGR